MTDMQESLLKLVQAMLDGVPPPTYRKQIIAPWVSRLPIEARLNAAERMEKSAMYILTKSLLEETP